MRTKDGFQYQKTIYTVLANNGVNVKVDQVFTNKKELWEYIAKAGVMRTIKESFTSNIYDKYIGSYSMLCSQLVLHPFGLKLEGSNISFTINTWKLGKVE